MIKSRTVWIKKDELWPIAAINLHGDHGGTQLELSQSEINRYNKALSTLIELSDQILDRVEKPRTIRLERILP